MSATLQFHKESDGITNLGFRVCPGSLLLHAKLLEGIPEAEEAEKSSASCLRRNANGTRRRPSSFFSKTPFGKQLAISL